MNMSMKSIEIFYRYFLVVGAQKTPIEKTYEINVAKDSLNIDILASNRQFDWLELSLVYDRSDKQTTIYDSYNVELATKTVKLTNFTEIYSLTNEENMK